MTTATIEARVESFQQVYQSLKNQVQTVIVGYDETVGDVLLSLFAGGHVLLEGVPGLGKTLLVRCLAQAIHTGFSRIQFTPDLMPADIVGTKVIHRGDEGEMEVKFQPGPIFSNIVLADEINRATPKTQSSLLEAMQERRVTVGGETRPLEEPFMVLATQNPIEMEGTYPLPEAQIDRFFFKLHVELQGEDEMVEILNRTTTTTTPEIQPVLQPEQVTDARQLAREVVAAEHVLRYAIRLVLACHPDGDHTPDMVKKFVKVGPSPRGVQALILGGKVRALCEGRIHLSCEDVRKVALQALRHRVLLNFEGEADNVSTDSIVKSVIEAVPEPPQADS